MSPRYRCLIAFDAFGTLFSPRAPIGRQYINVANAFLAERYPKNKELTVDVQDFQNGYMKSFQQHWKDYPNYGKESNMGPATWWRKLIRTTLDPFLRNSIKEDDWEPLSQAIWTQFSSDKGYSMHDDSRRLLEHLKSANTKDIQYIVGVVSNSDPRISNVLQSLGIKVPSIGTTIEIVDSAMSRDNHIQFIITSYDAGFAKPSKEIFDLAETTARHLLPQEEKQIPLLKIFVGDDYAKDGLAAIHAGWNSILVDRKTDDEISRHFPSQDILSYPNEAKPNSGNSLLLERVKSLWPFNPQILSTKAPSSQRGN